MDGFDMGSGEGSGETGGAGGSAGMESIDMSKGIEVAVITTGLPVSTHPCRL